MFLASKWAKSSKLTVNESGLLLRNLAIKPESPIRIRALGCRMNLKARLVGNSGIWLFSRVPDQGDQISPYKPVVYIRKIVETQRIFVNIGTFFNPLVDAEQQTKLDDTLALLNRHQAD